MIRNGERQSEGPGSRGTGALHQATGRQRGMADSEILSRLRWPRNSGRRMRPVMAVSNLLDVFGLHR